MNQINLKQSFTWRLLAIAAIIFMAFLFTSCARGLTPSQAANGAKCGQYVR